MPGQRQCNPKHKKKQDDWQERLPFCKTLETTKMKTLQKTDTLETAIQKWLEKIMNQVKQES